jgi:hypothetical protein
MESTMQTRTLTTALPERPFIARLAAFFRATLRRRRMLTVDDLPPHIRRDVGLPPEVHRPTHAPPRLF